MNQTTYSNENSGALFKNDKQGVEARPDYRGQLNVNGVDYWVSSWVKTSSKDGSKFMSLSVKPKDEAQRPAPAPRPAPAGSGFDDMDYDLPF